MIEAGDSKNELLNMLESRVFISLLILNYDMHTWEKKFALP